MNKPNLSTKKPKNPYSYFNEKIRAPHFSSMGPSSEIFIKFSKIEKIPALALSNLTEK
jgi:hypothetical protein